MLTWRPDAIHKYLSARNETIYKFWWFSQIIIITLNRWWKRVVDEQCQQHLRVSQPQYLMNYLELYQSHVFSYSPFSRRRERTMFVCYCNLRELIRAKLTNIAVNTIFKIKKERTTKFFSLCPQKGGFCFLLLVHCPSLRYGSHNFKFPSGANRYWLPWQPSLIRHGYQPSLENGDNNFLHFSNNNFYYFSRIFL